MGLSDKSIEAILNPKPGRWHIKGIDQNGNEVEEDLIVREGRQTVSKHQYVNYTVSPPEEVCAALAGGLIPIEIGTSREEYIKALEALYELHIRHRKETKNLLAHWNGIPGAAGTPMCVAAVDNFAKRILGEVEDALKKIKELKP